MRKSLWTIGIAAVLIFSFSIGFTAYHHMGEADSPHFLAAHPEKAGTKLDNCALCHTGGSYDSGGGKMVVMGSCQWCHYKYGYDGSGNIKETLNQYGLDYLNNGRSKEAILAIENFDSDGDGYSNVEEITANRYPGDAADDPSKVPAPAHVYTRPQLEAMAQHKQFLLMNTTKSGDFYAEYSGVTVEELLGRAGMLPVATGIKVYSPDGFSTYHPLNPDPNPSFYHVLGTYPPDVFHYDPEADQATNPLYGWCDYSAPSCAGRVDGDPIDASGGLKLLLAIERDGAYLTPGELTPENKLDGEGPFRVVPPQKAPSPPDQASTSTYQSVIWPYKKNWDHNAGFASRSATIIKVEPLPSGTTDINVLEAGWDYVDKAKIVVYGALDGSDSNGNDILDDEEGTDPAADLDQDGVPDFQDPDTATFRQAYGTGKIRMHVSAGDLANMKVLRIEAPEIPEKGLPPHFSFPYGAIKFDITGVQAGQPVTVKMIFPRYFSMKPARFYGVDITNGWKKIPFTSQHWDNTLALTLTDGDPKTDGDGVANGIISLIGAWAVPVNLHAHPRVIWASDGPFGVMLPQGAVKVKEGDSQIFHIRPFPGYKVADVRVDGESVGAVTSYRFINVDRNHWIYATFARVN